MNFENKLANNIVQDSKSFCAYVRSKSKTKDSINALKSSGGATITDHEEMANVLNEFFSSVFTDEDLNEVPLPENIFPAHGFSLININITPDIIKSKLSNFKTDKTPGIDSLHPLMLKELKEELSHPLYLSFKASLQESLIPTDWK